MTEYIGYTAPMADVNAILADADEDERKPISLEEMRDLRTFFGNRGINFGTVAETTVRASNLRMEAN